MTKVLYFHPAYLALPPVLLDLTDTAASALVSSGAGAYPVPMPIDRVPGMPTPTPTIPGLSITAPDAMPNGVVGSGSAFTPTISGGTPPYVLSVAGGALAPGRRISGLSIVGNYTLAGDYSYILRVVDSLGASANVSISVSVGNAANLLDDPVMYQIGASLEGQGLRGSANPVAYGFTAQTPLVWANHLAPKRLFTIQTGKHPTEPFYYRPTSYATGGAGYFSVPNPGWNVNDQVDLAVAHAQTLPNGRQKVVWYSGGRNDMTVASTYISRELANLDKLAAVFDLIIVPGLWKRDFSAADGWQKGGSNRGYLDSVNANFPAQLAARYGSKVIYVPLQAIMSDGTADENPKPQYLCDGQTHYSNLGAQATGKAVYDAIKDRFVGHVDTGNLISVSGNTGTLSNGVTGAAPAGFSVTKDPTVSVVASIPAAGSVGLALTTAVTQATVAEGVTIAGPTATLVNAGNYRARMHVRIDPTPARVVVGGGLLETTGGATPQRALGMFACRANAYAAVNIATTATASIDTLDATNGLDLYIDTPDMLVDANATVVPYVTIAADQGAVVTVNVVTSEWSVVRGADALPTFGFRYAGITKPEGNTGGTTVYGFEVIRSTGTGSVTIPYAFSAGTTDAADYLGGVLPSSGSVTFADGETSKLINVTVVGDGVEESAETFTITLSNPAGYLSNGSIVGTGIIVNDDGLQTFAFRDTWTETTAVAVTAHTANSGHTYARVGTYDMTISPGNNRVRWNAGTGYIRSSYAPTSANYDLKVMIRCVRLRASGIGLRMGADGGCVTVGYSANGASWSVNDRSGSNQLSGYTGGSPVTIELLRWYEMEVRVRGNTFQQFIDGVAVSPVHTFRTNYGANIGLTNITAYSSNGTEGWEYGEMTVTEYAA
ncbi:hypothetical protein ASE70_04880 [Sphingomonas sp. Leaf22]|uniref:Calx-beta domain-containing protein n=1 Tax=Sphingomonas sp. Leaf22 TaxID=1735687 RepID=UPI0006F72937|nr:Calx-beta domain-containing protein [Sphingomonas sp. Leaf22]KQM84885.1 hypothetical protein ASE70_04880 [Sphingomonas sp. Leaf22]